MKNSKAILITGASTGIGKACALWLDKMGLKVFAGVRKTSDGDALKQQASDRLSPVILDVTKSDTIDAALDSVSKDTNHLYGLVNNAGISMGGRLEIQPLDDFQKVFEVNVLGLVAVTKAFLPMLRKSRGRIVNIGSISSLVALPGMSSYAASKFAVRAITDSLRWELYEFGISVSLVAPGMVESDIHDKTINNLEQSLKSVKPEIAEAYAQQIKLGKKFIENIDKIKVAPANEVAKVVAHALTANRPKYIYLVGNDAKKIAWLIKLPRRILEWLMIKHMNKAIRSLGDDSD